MQAARVDPYEDDSDLWDALEPISEPESDNLDVPFELPPLEGNAHLKRTLPFTKILGGLDHAEIAIRMRAVIDYMAGLKLDVATFLHYLSWNLEIPVHMTKEEGVIRHARTALMGSPQLPGIVAHWLKPPRKHGQGIATRGGKDVLKKWALENVKDRLLREMKAYSPHFLSSPADVTKEDLLSVSLKDDIKEMKQEMTVFWDIMSFLGCTDRQLKNAKYKDYEPRIFMLAAILQYSRSQNYCRYQKELCLYLKGSGVAGKAGDTLHLFSLTMSQSWGYTGIDSLSESNRRDRKDDVAQHTIYGGHDNINLSFKVFESRKNKQTRFDSGTAGTIYVVKDKSIPPPDRLEYQAQRAIGCLTPVTAREILKAEVATASRLRPFNVFRIIQILLDHPSFCVFEAQNEGHPILSPPTPIEPLPTGPEHATRQHVMDTVPMEESSQDGNRRVSDEWFRQMGLDGEKALTEENIKRLFIWISDQLTAIRLRFLKKDHAFDMNFKERFEHILEIFGWFHAVLALEFSLHKQYYGTSSSYGFKHAFEAMGRKGLERTATQGNFHYAFRQALQHVAMARFRDIWTIVGKVDKIEKLAELSPEDIEALANKILDEFASNKALNKLRKMNPSEKDEELEHSIQFCRDLLDYLNLEDAMKTGDVGRMELLLPRLLFRFHGSGSHNYAHEMLELLQGLWKEWPQDLKRFIMRHCWLANTTGRKNGFLAFDMLQEHNIRDIKTIFAVHGPYSTWDHIKRISASIPTQRKLKDHIENEFNHFRRGKKHISPDHEEDVQALQDKYHAARVHRYKRGRKADCRTKDFIAQGLNYESLHGMITRWAEARVTNKSTQEDFRSVEEHIRLMDEEIRREMDTSEDLTTTEHTTENGVQLNMAMDTTEDTPMN